MIRIGQVLREVCKMYALSSAVGGVGCCSLMAWVFVVAWSTFNTLCEWKSFRVSNLFTMPNLLLACLQRQMGKHTGIHTKTHFESKSRERERETRIERKKKQNAELYVPQTYILYTLYYTYVDGYLCAFVFAPKICRNIRNILLGTRALLWCHLNMLWNFSIEAAKCQKERERDSDASSCSTNVFFSPIRSKPFQDLLCTYYI